MRCENGNSAALFCFRTVIVHGAVSSWKMLRSGELGISDKCTIMYLTIHISWRNVNKDCLVHTVIINLNNSNEIPKMLQQMFVEHFASLIIVTEISLFSKN